jgi:glycosyltransferase involved in cell wall biosynthesis
VVATRVGGVPEVVRHGETGLLVPYGDFGALADSVTGLLADRERMTRMGEAGQRLTLERHTWPRVVDRVLEAYKDARKEGDA